MNEKIKIFLVDDHPIVRDGLKSILQTQEDFEIIGEASNGDEALQKLEILEPDILISDLEMPEKDGLSLIQILNDKKTKIKIIVFTVFDTDERIISAIKSGAKGYLLKGAGHQEIFKAIRAVQKGESILQPIIASKLIRHIKNDRDQLSEREMEVLIEMGKGKKNTAIAATLFISERTVKFHVSSILNKLDVKNRTEAVQLAIKKGIINI